MGNGQSEILDKYIKVYIYGLEKKYSAAKNVYFSMGMVSCKQHKCKQTFTYNLQFSIDKMGKNYYINDIKIR